jgi:uncharacterized membrane protein YcaP (DUF421 family)
MEEIERELIIMYNRAEKYMTKGIEPIRDFGSGMMYAINEVHNLILKQKGHVSILEKIEKEVLKHMGHEGSKIDMELHYDGKLFCRSISNGGRTNNYYFKQVMNTMEKKGYDIEKFNIKVGDEIYIQ